MHHVFKTVSFVLSIPGTSSFCESGFSLLSSKWQDERKQDFVKLIKNELLIYFNIKGNCLKFAKNFKDTNVKYRINIMLKIKFH